MHCYENKQKKLVCWFFRKKSVESHLLFAAAFEMNVERAPEVDYVE